LGLRLIDMMFESFKRENDEGEDRGFGLGAFRQLVVVVDALKE